MGRLYAFLAGTGPDARGRDVGTVLAFDDAALERTHDYVQWLFPLRERSGAQPGAPVLDAAEIAAIRSDAAALANLRAGAARMLAFYRATSFWLAAHDHNHLRITRILASLRLLAGESDARDFHGAITALHASAGAPIHPGNLAYWDRALAGR